MTDSCCPEKQLQRRLTAEVELAKHGALGKAHKALSTATDEGVTDETFARAAWINADAISRAFVTAFPTPTTEYSPDELITVVAIYFGKRIPVLEGIVSREVVSWKGRKCGKVDPFESRLFCAALGDSWTKVHDYVKHAIAASMGGSGWHVDVDAYRWKPWPRRMRSSSSSHRAAMLTLTARSCAATSSSLVEGPSA